MLNVPSDAKMMEVSPVRILVSKFEVNVELENPIDEKSDVKAGVQKYIFVQNRGFLKP